MQEVEIKLSDWVFNAIQQQEVLTLHRDYFRLRKPLERRIYEIGRKHCGMKDEWRISLQVLQNKCGSTSTEKEFRRLVTNIVEEDQFHSHMPDYSLAMDDDMVIFRNRNTMPRPVSLSEMKSTYAPPLHPETFNDARIVAPGYDVYRLESEWRQWITEVPRDPDAAFIAFCKKYVELRGTAN